MSGNLQQIITGITKRQERAARAAFEKAERDRLIQRAIEQRDALGKALLRLYSLAIPNLAMNAADHKAIRDALCDAGLLPEEES